MGKEQEAELSEVREELGQYRRLFFLSSLALLSEEFSPEERIQWGFVWLAAFRGQETLTRNVISPVKRKKGLPITNETQEELVKTNLGNFAQSLGLPRRWGLPIAKFHIKHTKIIQREEGVGRRRK